LATIGTQLAAVSFAISGTVQEFLGSCIFIFVKHPYDVGDRVTVGAHELIVEKISLLYSVFRLVDSNKTIQMPNINLNGMSVENVSRSGAMKERVALQVGADTSFEDLENFKQEVQNILNLPENRRDFKDIVDIELTSFEDLTKLHLNIEVEHKVCTLFLGI
jgi:small-conductance mechanosensitive channel